jgi:hypothetical protein
LTGAHRIIPSVSYCAEAAAFIRNPDQNFQNQGISGGLEFELPMARPDQRFTFNASNRFRSVTELTGSAERSDIGPRTRRDENLLTTDIGYFLTRRDEMHLTYNRLDVDQIDLDRFLKERDASLNMILQPNDVIYVARDETIAVYGEVQRPGTSPLRVWMEVAAISQ